MADLTASPVVPGGPAAARDLFELLYKELRSLAHEQCRRHASGDLQTTALVNEAYLRFRAAGNLPIDDRQHFLAYASHVMRSVVVDQARGRLAAKRGAGITPVTLDTAVGDAGLAADADIVRIHDALDELTSLDERLGGIVEMKFFAGLTDEEIAEVLGVSARTVRRDWEKARLLLSASLQP